MSPAANPNIPSEQQTPKTRRRPLSSSAPCNGNGPTRNGIPRIFNQAQTQNEESSDDDTTSGSSHSGHPLSTAKELAVETPSRNPDSNSNSSRAQQNKTPSVPAAHYLPIPSVSTSRSLPVSPNSRQNHGMLAVRQSPRKCKKTRKLIESESAERESRIPQSARRKKMTKGSPEPVLNLAAKCTDEEDSKAAVQSNTIIDDFDEYSGGKWDIPNAVRNTGDEVEKTSRVEHQRRISRCNLDFAAARWSGIEGYLLNRPLRGAEISPDLHSSDTSGNGPHNDPVCKPPTSESEGARVRSNVGPPATTIPVSLKQIKSYPRRRAERRATSSSNGDSSRGLIGGLSSALQRRTDASQEARKMGPSNVFYLPDLNSDDNYWKKLYDNNDDDSCADCELYHFDEHCMEGWNDPNDDSSDQRRRLAAYMFDDVEKPEELMDINGALREKCKLMENPHEALKMANLTIGNQQLPIQYASIKRQNQPSAESLAEEHGVRVSGLKKEQKAVVSDPVEDFTAFPYILGVSQSEERTSLEMGGLEPIAAGTHPESSREAKEPLEIQGHELYESMDMSLDEGKDEIDSFYS